MVTAYAMGLYGGGSAHETYLQLMFNKTARAAWIQTEVAKLNDLGADGITFDIEGNEAVKNFTADALTDFLTELRAEAEKTNPHFQLSFETPVYPGQPQLVHANNWSAMIKPNGPVDFYVPMGCASPKPFDYEQRSLTLLCTDDMNGMGPIVRGLGNCVGSTASPRPNCWCTWAADGTCAKGAGGAPQCKPSAGGGTCTSANVSGYGGDGHLAAANSPLPGLMMSLDQFKAAGVPANRVVMGVPWYGASQGRLAPFPPCLKRAINWLGGAGYDYHCNDNTTGAPCNATVGSKQGAPQLTYTKAAEVPSLPPSLRAFAPCLTDQLVAAHSTSRTARPA